MANIDEYIKNVKQDRELIEQDFKRLDSEMKLLKAYEDFLDFVKTTVIPNINIEIELCSKGYFDGELKYSGKTLEEAGFTVFSLYDFKYNTFRSRDYKGLSVFFNTGFASASKDMETEKDFLLFVIKSRKRLKKIMSNMCNARTYYIENNK